MEFFFIFFSEFAEDTQISLCGYRPTITDDEFNRMIVSFEHFMHDPATIMDDERLVAKIHK